MHLDFHRKILTISDHTEKIIIYVFNTQPLAVYIFGFLGNILILISNLL